MPAIVVQNDSAMLNERLTQKYYGEYLIMVVTQPIQKKTLSITLFSKERI